MIPRRSWTGVTNVSEVQKEQCLEGGKGTLGILCPSFLSSLTVSGSCAVGSLLEQLFFLFLGCNIPNVHWSSCSIEQGRLNDGHQWYQVLSPRSYECCLIWQKELYRCVYIKNLRLNRHFSKEDRWPINTWKNVQHLSLLEKCKSKLQWGITSCWSALINLQTVNAGEGVKKREPSCTVGENINWYSHCGEQYADSFKN